MPTQWTKDDYLWKIALPGRGHSSPVTWQDDVFVTAADDKIGTRFVLCIDAGSGKTRWQARIRRRLLQDSQAQQHRHRDADG